MRDQWSLCRMVWVIIVLWAMESLIFVIGALYVRRTRRNAVAPDTELSSGLPSKSQFGSHDGDVHDLSFSARSRAPTARNGELNM